MRLRKLATIAAGMFLLASPCAWATFGSNPGSIQYRNPPWQRPYSPQLLIAANGTVAIDWRQGPWFQITLTGNVSFNPPLNVGEQCILITIIQDGTGSRTASWSNTSGAGGWKWSGATAGTLTTTAGAVDQVVACPWKSGFTNAATITLGTNFK